MSSDIQKNIKNAMLTAGLPYYGSSNNPSWQAGRKTTAAAAMRLATDAFIAKYGGIGTDVWNARLQGLDPADFERYTDVVVRMTTGASGSRMEGTKRTEDDIKTCMVVSPRGIDTIPRGAKLVTANGNAFIVVDTDNLSGGGTFRCWRASAEYGQLDYYGKPVYEPVVVITPDATGTQPSGSQVLVADHRIRCIMQKNSTTSGFMDNSRLLFDGIPYTAEGVTTTREITNRADTAYLYHFVLERSVLQPDDDVERGIPAGQSVTFTLTVTGSTSLSPGDTASLTVTATRNGESVVSTDEHPLTYSWTTSNENAVTVDDTGLVTAIAEGTATITVTLNENTSITASVDLTVEDTREPVLVWITPPPTSIEAYDSATMEAAYFDASGQQTGDAVTYTVTGGSSGDYTKSQSGNRLTITSYTFLYARLEVTASAHGLTLTSTVYLD